MDTAIEDVQNQEKSSSSINNKLKDEGIDIEKIENQKKAEKENKTEKNILNNKLKKNEAKKEKEEKKTSRINILDTAPNSV